MKPPNEIPWAAIRENQACLGEHVEHGMITEAEGDRFYTRLLIHKAGLTTKETVALAALAEIHGRTDSLPMPVPVFEGEHVTDVSIVKHDGLTHYVAFCETCPWTGVPQDVYTWAEDEGSLHQLQPERVVA